MDILRPNVIEIDGRCYRRLEWSKARKDDAVQVKVEERVEQVDELAWEGEGMRETDEGFYLALPIADVFHKFICGKKGETKKRLESDTGTKIKLPHIGQPGDIEITASTTQAISSAKTRLEILVDSTRPSLPWNHFVSIPLNTAAFIKQFESFKEQVMEWAHDARGLDISLFQNPAKLHLTIGVLRLYNSKEQEKASQVLQECLGSVIKPYLSDQGLPLTMQFTGLEYMNDDPSEVDVLYAKVKLDDNSNRLQKIVDGICQKFVSSGLMHQEYGRVKLHATLINSIKRQDDDLPEVSTVTKRPRISFDARSILQRFNNIKLGEVDLNEIHISKRNSVDGNGYYQNTAIVTVN